MPPVMRAGCAVEMLADALFSLDEPWRGRFLILVADMATAGNWHGRQPRQEQVVAWFWDDIGLYKYMSLMLNSWSVPGPRDS